MKTTVKSKFVTYAVAAVLIIFCLFPIYWMLITSLKTSTEIYKIIPTFWPKKLTFEGYYELFVEKGFLKNVWNSLLVSLIVSFGSIAVSMPAAYAIARIKFKGRKIYQKVFLFLT
jgi:carbohydrate ABC transporter membrane protein 2, CUT1 family (TC 3.A.1.1.-)